MLRRIWELLKDACTPHWDRYEDPAETLFVGGTIIAPQEASVIQAAANSEPKGDDDSRT